MDDKQIHLMLAKIVEEVDYDIYKDMFVYHERDDEAMERLYDIVRKFVNKTDAPKKAPVKTVKKKASGRVFVPITEAELKQKMKAFIYPNGNVDVVELYHHLEKDLKVNFDLENYSGVGNENKVTGFNTLDNGLTFYGAWAGGDWESAVTWIVYWDGKKLRGYVPTEGNPWNTDTKQAYGNDDTADLKNAKKRWPDLTKDMTEDDLDGFFDSDQDQIIEDIKKRLIKA